jgi:chromosome segregation ATPase
VLTYTTVRPRRVHGTSTQLKEEVARLQHENDVLKTALDSGAGEVEAVGSHLQRLEWQHAEERTKLRRLLETERAERKQLQERLQVALQDGHPRPQVTHRIAILERAKEQADETAARERALREETAAVNAELAVQLEQYRKKYGINELSEHVSSATLSRDTAAAPTAGAQTCVYHSTPTPTLFCLPVTTTTTLTGRRQASKMSLLVCGWGCILARRRCS